MSDEDATDVSIDLDIQDGRSLLTVDGERAVTVIVESASGEQIYLPPEDFAQSNDPNEGRHRTSPYDSPYDASTSDDTPYEGQLRGESPYESAGSSSSYDGGRAANQPVGVQSTPEGFQVLHPEPVHDVRLLR